MCEMYALRFLWSSVWLISSVGWGEAEFSRYIDHYLPTVPAKDDGWWVCSSRWNDWQGKLKYSEKTCPSAALSTINPTWPNLGSNLCLRSGKQATNHLSWSRDDVWLIKQPIGLSGYWEADIVTSQPISMLHWLVDLLNGRWLICRRANRLTDWLILTSLGSILATWRQIH
jgi:hypothetical protein